MARCTAKSKQSGQRCKRHASPGFTVCASHGGATPVGPAAPSYKTGRHSRHFPLPARMRDTYEAAASDQNLVELRDHIALLDARLHDVLTRVDSGESGAIWRDLRMAWAELQDANRRKDGEAAREALNLIGSLISSGHADHVAWAEIRAILDQRRKLVESERKRLVEANQVIRAEQAMTLIRVVVDSVKRHVTDQAALTRISHDLTAALNHPGQ